MNNDAPVGPEVVMRDNMRGERYCEIFVIRHHLNHVKGTVYNTLGLNDCPAEQWRALNPESLKKELKADAIVMNGPRYFLMDQATSENLGEVVSFHGMQLREVATIRIPLRSMIGGIKRKPYAEHTIERTNSWVFSAGKVVYELVAPDGSVYVMQSYAQIVDPTLTEASLATLASRLTLPSQWHYRVRTLEQEYVMQATGEVQVIQDDLENTYQRANS